MVKAFFFVKHFTRGVAYFKFVIATFKSMYDKYPKRLDVQLWVANC